MDIRKTTLISILAVAMAPAAALADRDRDRSSGVNRGEYDYARVTHVEPLYRTVTRYEPVRDCWMEDVTYRERRPTGNPGSTAGRTILGGLIGGAVGSQLGGGRGRDAATVAGVLIGSAIANDHARQDNWEEDRNRTVVRTDQVERCRTTERPYEERVVDGYQVTYEYNGQRYETRMDRDPGRTLRVWVSVRPAE